MTRVPVLPRRRAAALVAAGVAAAMALSTGQAVAAPHPVAPRLIDLTAPAGSSAAIAAPSGKLPTYALSTTRSRTKHAIGLKATKAKGQVLLAVPLATPGDSYYVLACRMTVCAASAKQLLVTPRLTHLLAPLRVHSTLSGSPVSRAMTAANGGTLVAHAAGGTTYTLSIPANALPDDTTVSIQPIGSLSGVSGVTGEGVRIEPEGLQLLTAASLTVSRTPAAGKGEVVTGAVAPDSGSGLALVPAKPKGSGYVEPVMHFSDHFTMSASDIRLDAIASHAAHSAADQIFGQAAEAFANHDFDAGRNAIVGSSDAYYDNVVRPLLQDALDRDSGSSAVAAVQEALAYLRAAALLGVEDAGFLDRLGIDDEMFAYLLSLQYRTAYNSCAAGDLKNGPYKLLGVARQAQLLGKTELFNDVFPDIDKCFTFRMDFDSDVAETQSSGGADLNVVAPVAVKGHFDLSQNKFTYSGTGPLTYAAATTHYHDVSDNCGGIEDTTDLTGTTPSTMSLVNMSFDPFTATSTDAKLSVGIDPGSPTETYREFGTECPDASAFDFTSDFPFWQFYWGSVLHYTEATTSSGDGESGPPWTFSTFTPGSGDLIGTQQIHQETDIQLGDSDDMGHLSEHTEIKLTHTPGPAPALPKKPKLPPVR